MSGRPARLRVDIVTDADTRGVDKADSHLSRLGSSAKKFAAIAATGMLVAGTAAVGMAVSVVKAASESQQAIGATQSVFGAYADSVSANAKRAADSVGLSATEYRNMASIVGSQLRNMGRSQGQAAEQSDKLIRLGSDLAATYGGSVSDAVEAVSSLLRGETDPIERYGVSIKQSDINARLAAQGLGHLTGAAAKQAQATAVLGLLTQQTASAHGQFAREASTLAGQQERLSAKFDNVKVAIGNRLLPAVQQATVWFATKLVPAGEQLAKTFATKIGPTVSQVAHFVSADLIPAAKDIVHWFADKIVPVLVRTVTPILKGVGSLFHSLASAIERNRPELEKLGTFMKKVAEIAAKILGPIIGFTLGNQFKILGKILGSTIDLIGSVVKVITDLIKWIDKLVGKLTGAISKVGDFVGKVGSVVGKLNPFSAVDIVGQSAAIAGPSSYLTPNTGRLATAALVDGGSGFGFLSGRSSTPFVIDRRDQSTVIRIDGALDPVSVAEQLRRMLDDHEIRLGRAPAYSGGR